MEVTLEDDAGRGDIRLVEQPRESNNYTARVSIRDPQGGSGEYSFTLVWKRPSDRDAVPVVEAQRGMLWSGVVDGRARVTIKGSSSISEAFQGAPISGERVDFLRPLPSRSDLKPAVKKSTAADASRLSNIHPKKTTTAWYSRSATHKTDPPNTQSRLTGKHRVLPTLFSPKAFLVISKRYTTPPISPTPVPHPPYSQPCYPAHTSRAARLDRLQSPREPSPR